MIKYFHRSLISRHEPAALTILASLQDMGQAG
jgi:hypothetical protein